MSKFDTVLHRGKVENSDRWVEGFLVDFGGDVYILSPLGSWASFQTEYGREFDDYEIMRFIDAEYDKVERGTIAVSMPNWKDKDGKRLFISMDDKTRVGSDMVRLEADEHGVSVSCILTMNDMCEDFSTDTFMRIWTEEDYLNDGPRTSWEDV